jgi:hypothetical protein
MKKRVLFLILGVLVIGLMMTSVALASAQNPATPQDIYDDYAGVLPDTGQPGKLDGPKTPYTDEELQAYLNDATIHLYGEPTITDPLDDLVTDMLSREEFPFTGFQLMIAGIVAVVLVGGGVALRRLSRPQKS